LLKMPLKLNRQSGTVNDFLTDLNNVPGLRLSYSSGLIDLSRQVQLNGNETTVEQYLQIILKGQSVKYLEENGKIILVADRRTVKSFTVSGYITDKENGERLIGASLFIAGRDRGTSTNAYGFFSLTLDEDSLHLLVSYSGYSSQNISIDRLADTSLNLALERRNELAEIVVVNAESKNYSHYKAIPGKTDVSSRMIKSMPALLGEADVLKALQLLPGINAGNEGTSGLNVRGGSPDQNLILLDGVPVYNSSHAFGVFSIFNADAVHNVEVLKGGFPASYGGRLSSVVDVRMKEGDRNAFHGEGGIGLVFSKITLEGPWQKGRSSFLVSARRTYADLIIRPIMKAQNGEDERIPYFSDIILKSNFPVGKKGRIYFSVYSGADRYKQRDKQELNTQKYQYAFNWSNVTGMTRWNHQFNPKLFGNLTLNYSRFTFHSQEVNEFQKENELFTNYFQQKYSSGIKDINLKYDLDYLPRPSHFVKLGISATRHHYKPGIVSYFQRDTALKMDMTIDNHSVQASEVDAYAEDDIRISAKIKSNIGLRFSSFFVQGHSFLSLQPRVSIIYRLNNRWSLKTAAAKMNQFLHLLTNSNMGLPTDLWVPVTSRIPPQVAYQYTAGVSFQYEKQLEASMEVYYKQLKNVIEYEEGAGFNNAFTNWEDIVETGKGRAYGAEWLVQKTKGKVTGLFSYAISKSTRKFDAINKGRTFPYKYDRRHEVKAAIAWKPSFKFELAGNGIIATGNAISLPSAYYVDPFNGNVIDVYTGRNDYRLPLYHRVDVAMKFIKQKKRYLRTWIVSVYNVYNRQNAFYIYKYNDLLTGEPKFAQVSLFPVLPSVTYQFKF
ncbi:MAG: TonB-dependent receptor, partial [Chitinophagaceae bacterium]